MPKLKLFGNIRGDLFGGVTAGIVALPLALGFGVASGLENGAAAVLLHIEGGEAELAKDICMHIAAMRPAVATKEELDPAEIEKERDILTKAALAEGKPENIVAKVVEGRLGNFYAERCLAEQPFVKDDKQTVSQVAAAAGMKIVRYVHWELEKE